MVIVGVILFALLLYFFGTALLGGLFPRYCLRVLMSKKLRELGFLVPSACVSELTNLTVDTVNMSEKVSRLTGIANTKIEVGKNGEVFEVRMDKTERYMRMFDAQLIDIRDCLSEEKLPMDERVKEILDRYKPNIWRLN